MALDAITQVAEPSPAESQVEETSSHAIPVVEELSDKGREKWLKEPASYPKPPKRERPAKVSQSTDTADSSPAAEVDDTSDSSPEPSPEEAETAETAAESAPAEPQQSSKPRTEGEARIKSLLAENKVLKQRISQNERDRVTPAATPKVEAAASTEPALEKPNPEKFATVGEYFEALSDYKVELALRGERQRVAEERAQSQVQQRTQAEREQWNTKVGAARKSHTDFDTVALNPDLPVAEGSAIDWWVMNSEHGAEVLYHFASHPDELEALNSMGPLDAARTLAKVEFDLQAPAAPAQRKVPQAPPPPREANPKGKVDPLAAALAAGDFSTYRRLKDAEERGKRS